MNRQNEHKWSVYVDDTSFRFNVTAYYHKIPQKRQHQVIESFSYMDFRGKIDMKNPDVVMTVYEECMSLLPLFDLECSIPKTMIPKVSRKRNTRETANSVRCTLAGW